MRQRKIGKKTSKKLVGLFIVVILAFVALAVRITYISATDGERYERIVMTQAQQQYESRTIPFQRGDITDRNGTILATSEKVYNVILDCKVVNSEVEELDGTSDQKYLEPTVDALVSVLGLNEADIRSRLESEDTKNSQYQILKKGVSITDKKKFEDYLDLTSDENKKLSEEEKEDRQNVKGVWFEEDYVRTYPLDSLACDTIGFTYDGSTADWGIEGYYSDILNGTNGRQYGYFNTDDDVEQTIIPAKAGRNVVSTIDANIQQIIRKALENYENEMADDRNKTNGALGIGVVVMDPNTGEVLGMDSDRWYDLNKPRDLTKFYTQSEIDKMSNDSMMDALNELWGNVCISNAFEPGSVYKPITIASALSAGVINKNSHFYCDGGQQVADKYIACEGFHGDQTLDEALKNSCNDALMQIGAKLGEDEFLKYQNIFNMGMKTGIDLPGENAGVIFTNDTMGPVELATSSFGQGFTLTMIQETAAICAAINGGYYYRPHVVKQITDENGAVVKTIDPILERRTNSEEVSAEVREAMGAVMTDGGTGYVAKIPGYTMGGKTGTAEKLPRGQGNYVLDFVNFAPLNNPQVCLYVTVDEPNAANQETTIYAMSIARNIMTELLPYMNIFPDEEGYDTSNVDTTTMVTNAQMINREYTTAENGVSFASDGTGTADTAGTDAGTVDTYTDDTDGTDDTDTGEDTDTTDTAEDTDDQYLYQDTTLGTADDGSDLPTVPEQSEDDVTYGNDYFSDGITNEDAQQY